jgi:hypothetical protein
MPVLIDPVVETMITGNISDMLESDILVSSDRVNFGSCIMPWICFPEIMIS